MFIYIKKINKLVPKINSSMLEKGSSGVRAQAMDEKGNLIMDFRILKEKNQIHVLNAPSPGATSCFSIADYVIEKYL
jgi:L-2-hydroxyglutarate oxidase